MSALGDIPTRFVELEGEARFYFGDGHQRCEGCPARLCLEADCGCGDEPVAFSYGGLDYCAACADEARATLAEDIARATAHDRREQCAVPGCMLAACAGPGPVGSLVFCPQCDHSRCTCEVRVIGGPDLARDILALVRS